MSIYKDSERLTSLSAAFYTSILSALGHVLNYLRRKSSVKKASANFIHAVIRPANFQRELVEKIDQITKDRNAFNEEADICHKEMLDRLAAAEERRSEATMDEIQAMQKWLRMAAWEQNRANRVMGEMLEAIKRQQNEIGKNVSIIKAAVTKPQIALPHLMKLLQGGDVVSQLAATMRRCSLRAFSCLGALG